MKTIEMIKNNFVDAWAVYYPDEQIDEEVFEATVDELAIDDDEPFDKTMVDDVMEVYPELLFARENWANECRDLF